LSSRQNGRSAELATEACSEFFERQVGLLAELFGQLLGELDPRGFEQRPAAPTQSVGPLRAAVVGAGKISEEHLKFLASSRQAMLVGVCDRSPSMARIAADAAGTTPYTDLDALLAVAVPQVVHVLTPPHTHVELAAVCLRAGTHVVIEKPVAPTH
jgi:phosphoglycerate dehydrogenase-like enzyme